MQLDDSKREKLRRKRLDIKTHPCHTELPVSCHDIPRIPRIPQHPTQNTTPARYIANYPAPQYSSLTPTYTVIEHTSPGLKVALSGAAIYVINPDSTSPPSHTVPFTLRSSSLILSHLCYSPPSITVRPTPTPSHSSDKVAPSFAN